MYAMSIVNVRPNLFEILATRESDGSIVELQPGIDTVQFVDRATLERLAVFSRSCEANGVSYEEADSLFVWLASGAIPFESVAAREVREHRARLEREAFEGLRYLCTVCESGQN